MNKLIASLAVMILAGAVIVGGATSAFFSDTETSTGNTFTAGALDLKIDNDSYYNGNRCTDIDGDGPGTVFQWQGSALFPVPGTECSTSWPLSDLGEGLLFFNFTDLKPDDEGEDTISIHVQNDAWACLDMTLTSDDDNSTTEPEGQVDTPEDTEDTWDGELADTIQMFWWADDGDNVFEDNEEQITPGVQSVTDMFGDDRTFSATLADVQSNAWGVPGPLPANETVYIAKAWCMGTLTLDPVPAGQGVNPSVASGVSCDGTTLNNLTQTDGATLDIAFRAVQARHNTQFVCGEEETRTATLTVTKVVTNNNGGNNIVADFQLFADNGTTDIPMTSGNPTQVAATTYTITETGISGYVASFSGDCDSSGQITLLPGDNKQCTITNDDLPGSITLIKNVVNDNGGTATANSAWGLRIDGNIVPNNTSVGVTANVAHSINEDGRTGYHFVSITGNAKCPAVLGGTATLDEGEAITCTITNNDNVPPPLVENFGTGTCLTDVPGWDEDAGESCTNGTVAAAIGTGDNTVSPEGGRFGLLSGNNGYLCRSVNATGFSSLELKYYWRGDTEAEDNETGSVGYFTTGTCAAPGPITNLAQHELDDLNNNASEPWSALQTIALPGALDNTTFFVRFSADSNGGNESFRLDGISVTGI